MRITERGYSMNVKRRIEEIEKRIMPATPFPYIIWPEGNGKKKICQSGSPVVIVEDEEDLQKWLDECAEPGAQIIEVKFGKS